MNDVVHIEQNTASMTQALAAVDSPVAALAASETYAGDMFSTLAGFELAQRMAMALAKSTLLPKEFQNNAANCLVLLDIASRFKNLGVSPFTVAQQVVVVHGRPAWMGQFVIAIINRSGLFTQGLQFQFDGEGADYGCTAWTMRRDGSRIEGVKITRKMVAAEGWSKNPKWQNMEAQMFQYRAAAFFGRIHCPELLMGYHTADELEDLGQMRDAGRSTATSAATSTLLDAINQEKAA